MARRNKKCSDCDTLILEYSKRCNSCAQKERFTRMDVWNKGLPNTWFNPKGLEAGWKAAKKKRELRINKECKWCEKKFDVQPCLDRIQCCSRSCTKRLQLQNSENHPNWRGGKGTERHRLMGKEEYVLWRTAVFIRDNYTCQECNMRGGELNADHIKPWSLYPELRYAIDNGRTLCVSCHRQTDTWGFKGIPRDERRVILRR